MILRSPQPLVRVIFILGQVKPPPTSYVHLSYLIHLCHIVLVISARVSTLLSSVSMERHRPLLHKTIARDKKHHKAWMKTEMIKYQAITFLKGAR